MTDVRKRIFLCFGKNKKIFKINIVKHFTEMLFHKVGVYVYPVEQKFIKEACFTI